MIDINESKFKPFIRVDQYGHLGTAPQAPLEYLRLTILSILVVPLKFFGCLACVISFYCVCRISALLPKHWRDEIVPRAGKLHCRVLLFCVGFVHISWVKVKATESAATNGEERLQGPAAAIVSNHVGWADILLHMARSFPSFVSRSATKDLLWIGLISQLMGCIYVDRSTTKTHQGVAGVVKDRIVKRARGAAHGDRPMLLFPEGTTTNGNYLLPFRKGAFLAGAPVQPVIIRYPVNRVSPAWETISGLRHIWLMLCNPVHSVIFYELPVYHPTKTEASDPELYANNVREYMLRNSYGLEPSESSLADKQVLHAYLRGEEPPSVKKRE